MKTPCKNGCIMCGTCCVVYTITDDALKKPSYVPCKNLIYDGEHAKCSIHATSGLREPKTCQDYKASENYKRAWFDHRFAYYKKTTFMKHMVWCSKNGYLDHLPIMQAIQKKDYTRADDVFKYFIKPYLICLEGTVASEKKWLTYWNGLMDYIREAKKYVRVAWFNLSQNIDKVNPKRLEVIGFGYKKTKY